MRELLSTTVLQAEGERASESERDEGGQDL